MKVGDMVLIVLPHGPIKSNDPISNMAGKAGTIVEFYGTSRCIIGRCWEIKLADGLEVWVAEACLRLIPGDSEGRKLVEWNWRDLLNQQPQLSQVRLSKTEMVPS